MPPIVGHARQNLFLGFYCSQDVLIKVAINFQLHWTILKFSMTSQSTVAREIGSWQLLISQLIVLPSEIIHDKFQPPTPNGCRDMPCRLHQRISCQKRGVGWKFIDFQKLHTLPLAHAKFQVNRTILNFDSFSDPLSKIRGRGTWVGSMTFSKMAAMDSQDLHLGEKHHVTAPPLLKKSAGQREQKVAQDR